MSAETGHPETALITGASSGIGRALARQLAEEGARIILVARRAERLGALSAELNALGAAACLAFPLDLASPNAPQRLWSAIRALGWPVNLLVNNAGFGDRRPFREIPLERQEEMLRVNINALVSLTGLFLPGMRERGQGGVIQVASTAAFQPGPGMATYYASKAFVLAFGEALHEEERPFGITVTTLCPGPTRSEFGALAGEARSPLMRQGQAEAEDVARCGLNALRKGRALAFPNLGTRIGSALPRLLPRSWMRRLVKRLQ